jgi:RND family efflux transporter MFP subunit
VAQPAPAPFTSYLGGAGIVEASTNNISVGTSLAGIVQKVCVQVGDKVKAGAPLLQLDDRERRADLSVKQANHIKAKTALEEAKAALLDYQAQYALVRHAVDRRAVSVDEVQKRRYAELLAKAKVESAKAAVTVALADIKAVQSSLDRLTVRAPIDGRVLQVNVRPGEYAPTGVLSTPLIRLGNLDRLHIRVDIDENDAWRFQPDTRAVAFLRGNRDLKTELAFVRVEPFVTAKVSLTGSSTERVDTRVLQIIYSFDPQALPVYVGQQMDIFIESPEVTSISPPGVPVATTGGKQ